MSTSLPNKVKIFLSWLPVILLLLGISFYNYNPWPFLASALALMLVLIVSHRAILIHGKGIWGYFSENENRLILLLLAVFIPYAYVELRSIDTTNLKNNKEVLEKLNTDGDEFRKRFASIDNQLATTTNGHLATTNRDIHEAFADTCQSASKKIRAAFIVSSTPNSLRYLTDEIIKLMKNKDKLVYEAVFIVDKNIINSGNVDKFDEIVEKEWSKKFADEGLDDRFELRVIQSETPLNLDVLIADENDVYLSFFNRQANKLNLSLYPSDVVIFYRNQRDTAQYFGEWFNKTIWERALKFNDWKYRRSLLN